MIVIALQSGSNGNCVYIEAGATRLLFDAGISGARAERRLAAFGRDIRDCRALLLSHDHADHAACAGVYHRKFGLPVYATRRTLAAARRRRDLGPLRDVRPFRPGETMVFDGLRVETVPTPHDGAEPSAFVVEAEGRRLGLLTDLGHVFDGLHDVVASLDAVVVESNYDPEMLEQGPYPGWLKERVRGQSGHLSNIEAAALLRDAAGPRLQWACLAHLSEQNNTPRRALQAHREAVGQSVPLRVAGRDGPVFLPEL